MRKSLRSLAMAFALLTASTLAASAADIGEHGDFGGSYGDIGPGAAYPDYAEVYPVLPAPAPGYAPALVYDAPPPVAYDGTPIAGYHYPLADYAAPPVDAYDDVPYEDVTLIAPGAGVAMGFE